MSDHFSEPSSRERDQVRGSPGKLCDSVLSQETPDGPTSAMLQGLLMVKPKNDAGIGCWTMGKFGVVPPVLLLPPQPKTPGSKIIAAHSAMAAAALRVRDPLKRSIFSIPPGNPVFTCAQLRKNGGTTP